MVAYRNPHHQEAFARARAVAQGMTLEQLQNGKAVDQIVGEIRVITGMYQKKALCRRMAEQAISLEIEQRGRADER